MKNHQERCGAASDRKMIFAVVLGNGLEIFDFTVYSFFAVWIGKAFFPANSAMSDFLFAVGAFGVGFFARPVGAIMLGRYADRAGRRAAMALSILLAALGTAVIALCPPWSQIGWFAPVCIVCARLLQGFAAGGEVGATTTWLFESAPLSRRGRRVSLQMVSQGIAAIAGALCGFSISGLLETEALAQWGWRIPFAIGALIAPLGYYLRRHLPETLENGSRGRSGPALQSRTFLLPLTVAAFLTIGQSVTMYVMVFYMPGYLTRMLALPAYLSFMSALASSVVFTLCAYFGGWVVDRFGELKKIALGAFAVTALCCLPAFGAIVYSGDIGVIVLASAIMAGLLGLGVVATLMLIMSLFPPSLRVTGFALSYALANTLFGGTAQFIVTALLIRSGNNFVPAWYLLVCNLLAIAALFTLCKRQGKYRIAWQTGSER
ncbi:MULTISPECIES: MFS transporter [Tenebrionibacter/Tenebrionicola group]|jgi:MHS family proline/betaine transporter-like MFS transporter|uniref:MFS transporter n=2 Tax=Tenebrionibacter/Tenebrionicola group TaxID=2969848 RepID=A0A8K0Y0D6_9ENTR|nr:MULTISPECIES: MFS transporter [Tenebrionibacter/Tenebrionicola group]MBK4716524.1 MFS transporter [Tenebrionibacter intestinalis]MBV5097196.1 MFS transporter [Tenebrionicola larvae]